MTRHTEQSLAVAAQEADDVRSLSAALERTMGLGACANYWH